MLCVYSQIFPISSEDVIADCSLPSDSTGVGSLITMGARRGALAPPPWNLKKMTSYAAILQITLKFSLATTALAIDNLYLNLKRCEKKRENFRLRLRPAGADPEVGHGGAELWSIFYIKNCAHTRH